MLSIKTLLKLPSHSSTEPEPLLSYSLLISEPVKETWNSNVEQDNLYVSLSLSLSDSVESEAFEPLSAEMKVDEESVPKPTPNDELIENSDQVPIESYTLMDEPTAV